MSAIQKFASAIQTVPVAAPPFLKIDGNAGTVPEGVRQLEISVLSRADSLLSPTFFPDFETEFQKSAISDYLNVFSVVPQFCSVAGRSDSIGFLRKVRETGTPAIADYFCIKAISKGVTMDSGAIARWKALSEQERESYRQELHSKHLHKYGFKGMYVIGEIDGLAEDFASLVDAVLESDAAGELDDELFVSAVSGLESIVFTVAQKLKILGD